MFSFSYSPFLARFSAEYFHTLEKAAGAPVKHQGPVTFKSLQQLELVCSPTPIPDPPVLVSPLTTDRTHRTAE